MQSNTSCTRDDCSCADTYAAAWKSISLRDYRWANDAIAAPVPTAMSSALALKQLKSLQESRERPDGSKDIKKAIRKKRRSNKKQSARAQQQAAKQQQSSKLEYYKATTSTQKATAEIMSKVGTRYALQVCFVHVPQYPTSGVSCSTYCCGTSSCPCSCWVSLHLKTMQPASQTSTLNFEHV